MTDTHLNMFCLVDGESTPFPVEIESTKTIGDLKDLIKAKIPDTFNGVDAKDLTLWRVSILDDDNDDDDNDDDEDLPILLDNIPGKDRKKLKATRELSDIFDEKPAKRTIHIIVQRPQPVHAPVPARVSTPLSGHLSDQSRPGTPLSGKRYDVIFVAVPLCN
ncbi:hypothetical protein BGZ82_011511 [Podila clonocystis]|nr:hypothetical protein BGZ82_011511 [Podila clonocystis]